MATRVFLSHTAKDLPRVLTAAAELTRHGFVVWMATHDLPQGERLAAITDQLATTDRVVVFLSRAAVNSRWVRFEMETAVALKLGDKPITIIPVLLEAVRRPTVVASLTSVDFYRDSNEDNNIRRLIAALEGHPAPIPDSYVAFQNYVEHIARVDQKTFNTLNDFAIFFRNRLNSTWEEDHRSNARMRKTVAAKLLSSVVDQRQREQVLTAFDRGISLPVVVEDAYSDISEWIRASGDEELVDLAAELWRSLRNGLRGVTAAWFEAYVRESTLEPCDPAINEYRADALLSKARRAGLLAASTEWNDPRTYAGHDALDNPSFDMGPMTSLIGRLADAFQSEASLKLRTKTR